MGNVADAPHLGILWLTIAASSIRPSRLDMVFSPCGYEARKEKISLIKLFFLEKMDKCSAYQEGQKQSLTSKVYERSG